MSKPEVTWKSENEGTIKDDLSSKLIYSPRYGVEMCMASMIRDVILNPKLLNKFKKEELSDEKQFALRTRETNRYLQSIHPKISDLSMHRIHENSPKFIIKSIQDAIEIVKKMDEKKMSNIAFLLSIGGVKGRNWKKGCVICLSDEMMGTTCGCGHTEIVMFRPCGHTICINPCFEKWTKHLDIELDTKTLTFGDQVFTVPSQRNVELDLSKNKKAICPTCRTSIRNTFRVEETYLSDTLFKYDVEGLASSSYYMLTSL